MITLVTADLHLSPYERDRYRMDALGKLADRARAAGVTRTIILGDLTEQKDRHVDRLVNAVVDHIRAFAELGPVLISQGNHDYSTDPDIPFFGFLRHVHDVRWIGRPTGLDLKGVGQVLFLPHTRDHTRDWKGIDLRGYEYIFAHNTFAGASVGFGRKMDGIPTKVFPKKARVISGDVHIPQVLDCVEYVGAPYLVDFGDDYKPRVMLIDGDDVESMDLSGEPQKRLVEFDSADDNWRAAKVNKGDILKIRISLTRREAASWPELKAEAREWGVKRGCIVHAVIAELIEDENGSGPRVEVRAREHKTDLEIMREFAEHKGVDQETLKAGELYL
jgi:hypothetical protein